MGLGLRGLAQGPLAEGRTNTPKLVPGPEFALEEVTRLAVVDGVVCVP